MKTISLDQLLSSAGKEVGVSPWRVVSQTMIDQFADATDDHQFIHVDPERAAKETQFGGTIAHGFLLLSLLSAMTFETLPPLEGSAMGINHGFDKIRFQAPVKSGARIRARFFLADVNARPSRSPPGRRSVWSSSHPSCPGASTAMVSQSAASAGRCAPSISTMTP